MVETKMSSGAMLRLTNPDTQSRKICGTLLVLVAVCSLAVSVTTRYGSSEYSSPSKTLVVQQHGSSGPSRQRLTQASANWPPPVVRYEMLELPAEHSSLTPIEHPAVSTFLEESLYNRPPPSFQFLS